MQVATEARRIADARGTPQDIEWAIDAEGTLWILQARPMTALPPDVSWDSPAPGAYTRMLRFGEWISEPVTPLFESWLLTAMEDRMHALFRELIGQIAPRPYHVVVNGWYFYSMNFISGGALLRSLPTMLVAPDSPSATASPGSSRRPFATAFPIVERMWREDLQPRYRAAVADAAGRVETLPVAELPSLIDELAELAGEYFVSIAALSGAGVQDGDEPRAGSIGATWPARSAGATCRCSPASSRAAARQRHAIASLDWWHAPHAARGDGGPAETTAAWSRRGRRPRPRRSRPWPRRRAGCGRFAACWPIPSTSCRSARSRPMS